MAKCRRCGQFDSALAISKILSMDPYTHGRSIGALISKGHLTPMVGQSLSVDADLDATQEYLSKWIASSSSVGAKKYAVQKIFWPVLGIGGIADALIFYSMYQCSEKYSTMFSTTEEDLKLCAGSFEGQLFTWSLVVTVAMAFCALVLGVIWLKIRKQNTSANEAETLWKRKNGWYCTRCNQAFEAD